MTNYSRTTLRELKKRYLNVLKKCLLANLLAFSFMLPAGAETASEDRLSNYGEKTYTQGVTFKDLEHVVSVGNSHGGAIYNSGTITFGGLATFEGNTSSASGGHSYGGAITNSGSITFGGLATFEGNEATSETDYIYGGAIYNSGTITFGALATFEGNTSSATGGYSFGGAIRNEGSNAVLTFNGDTLFTGNKAESETFNAEGGAIRSNAGSVVFEDTDNNAETPAVPNITYGMTFKGDTTFTGNKAESETGNSYGGAIWNSSYMLLAGENTFGGYEVDKNGDYILDSEGNKISLGNKAKYGGAIYNSGGKKEGDVIAYGMTFGKAIFMGNTALSLGGAIYNSSSGTITFGGLATFEGNITGSETEGEGGAIYNAGVIKFAEQVTFGGDSENLGNQSINGAGVRNKGTIHFNSATFKNNVASRFGGGISNVLEAKAVFEGTAVFENNKAYQGAGLSNSGEMTFDKLAVFQGNQVTNFGGGVWNYIDGNIVFKNTARFVQNTAQTRGGGVYNQENISFTSADFIGNKALSSEGESYGGAIWNSAEMQFSDLTIFDGNKAQAEAGNAAGGAIYNNLGKMLFEGDGIFRNNTALSTMLIKSDGSKTSSASGGAIYNLSGSVVFEDTDNNTETPAVPNITYGMTFKGDTLFTGNKAESETGNSHGGAIFNTGYMLLSGKNTFGGYEVDKNGDYVLDSEGNKISLGNQAKDGGAIYNAGGKKEGDVIAYGMTLGKSTFMRNTALSNGGAVYNSGYMNFTDDALFEGNEASNQGGAIYNTGTITFGGLATFEGNTADKGVNSDAYGGAIVNAKNITFKEKVIFKNNEAKAVATAVGGAIFHYDGITVFEKGVLFEKNRAQKGGAIGITAGTVTFKNGVEFSGNRAPTGNDVYFSGGGTINFGAVPEDLNQLSQTETGAEIVEGGFASANEKGVVNKYSNSTLTFLDSADNTGFKGTFNQYIGKTIAHSEKFLAGTNNILGGVLETHGAKIGYTANIGDETHTASLIHHSTATGNSAPTSLTTALKIGVSSTALFDSATNGIQANYELTKDMAGAGTVTFKDAHLTLGQTNYNGAYIMGENVTLNMQDGDTADSVSFANLTGSANLKIDADIVKGANGLELVTDQIITNSDATLKLNLTDVVLSENALDNGLSESYTATVMTGGTLSYGSGKGLVATDVYQYEVSGANNQITIDAVKFNEDEDSDVMKSVAEFDGDAAFNMTIGGDSYAMQSDVVMTENTKSIVGKDKETSTLTAKKITVNGATLNVENVSVSGENQLIDVASGTLNVTTAKVDNIKNAGEATLDTAEVSELENAGTLTANGSEIGELMNEKDAEVTGGKVTKVTNNGELTVTEATITELVNEQEATITDGELETATNKEKGMLSLSAGLRAGTVTNEGELTLDGVTVADLTNSATLKANGSTLTKLVNEQEAELTASTVEDLTNTGKMTAKDLTLKGALKGAGTATLSGKLVADDIFKSENKIISDGMEVSENVQKMELADLEIKSGTTLDIGTREVTAKDVKVGDKATLQVTLNNLDEHGTMKADKIEAGAGAGVHLVLGEKFEGGVFDVFKGTKGAGDLEVKHNNLYNVIEVEEGKYSFMTKDTEALQESLGATKEEVSVAEAMTQGTSTNEAFNKMQSEMLIALQSLDTQTVENAKEALSAVGSKEQPIEQSVASEHLVALQNVVQAELHDSTVGHSGGDTDPRAKVYIKGLYDRTKSSMGEGFRACSKGAVLGVQSEVTDTLTLGVGYATSQTTAKEDLRRTEVKTNTGFISAHYQPNAWWVSGLATFSRGEYEEEKQVLSSTGKATYDVDSWGAQVMTGYDIKLENAIITPEVGMRYLSVKQEGYTDTLGTTVSGTRSDYLTALVGVKGTWNMGVIRPTAGVTVGYDIISDDVSALNTLANGASYTVNGEALDRLSTTLTTGIEADLGDRTTLKLEYSGTYRKEYVDHSGMLKLEVKF